MKTNNMWRLWCSCLFTFGVSSFVIYELFWQSPRQFGVFEGFDNVNGAGNGCYIIPNIIHFIRFNQPKFKFLEAVCVLAALKNQKPDKIYFHTNSPKFVGPYWDVIMSTPGVESVIELKNATLPDTIFGQKFNGGWKVWHASDIVRIKVLMKYGGIFLDNDSYVVKSLNKFRAFEMSVCWESNLPTQINNGVIIAHKNARFLKEWLMTYKGHYDNSSWFYNAGIRPVEVVLSKRPELVHKEGRRFAEYRGAPCMLYLDNSGVWRDHYVIHLYVNHMCPMVPRNLSCTATYPVVFNETNIHGYDANIREMVYDVYPFNQTMYPHLNDK
ncbi:hypothetical protein GE061_006352 [Apolygus lucorum]|uniref:Alpha-1,4-N-acetylglucosaminyltransferase n=1 Tax=Apolygus lucorum TaxID=248454 RepID=A0A8S9WTI8_APOLU|nr:hypothetical protein GE061_006352 [Apolygus lucorum]